MKTASIAKTLLSVAFAAATVTFVQAQPKESAIVAHRGYWNYKEGGYARNSLAALESAQKAGFWGSEFDVNMTSDGELLIFHDAHIDGKRIDQTPTPSSRTTGWRTANRSRRSINTWLRRRNTPKRCWSSR